MNQKNIIELKKHWDTYLELQKKISKLDISKQLTQYKKLQKEIKKEAKKYELYVKYEELSKNIDELRSLIESNDEDLKKLASIELEDSIKEFNELDKKIENELMWKDPLDFNDAIFEIKGAAGGAEANLFASDLFDMYNRFCTKKGFSLKVNDVEETDQGGYSFISFEITGEEVYGELKFESGVHRVQRVPVTESLGRVHTSTVTVAVFPKVEINEIEINANDLRIDTYRASGAGGQHVNKTDSAVRITHIPTGLVVQSQDGRSQISNKEKAMSTLASKIHLMQVEENRKQLNDQRKNAFGSGERSEKIRTYNYPQNRVTDHRIQFTLKKLDKVMEGNIQQIIDELKKFYIIA